MIFMHLYRINFKKANRIAFPNVEKEFNQVTSTNYLTDDELILFATPITLGHLEYIGEGVDPSLNVKKFADLNPDASYDYLVDKVDRIEKNLSGIQADSTGKLTEPINVLGADFGNYKDGDIIPPDTSYSEIFQNVLTKEVPPVYTPPYLTISSNYDNVKLEVGSSVELTIIPQFSINDCGGLVRYILKRGSTILVDSPNAISFSEGVVFKDSPTVYTATAYFNDGSVKNTSLGNPFPGGKIAAGRIEKSLNIQGERKMFFGLSLEDSIQITSDFIRSLNSVFFEKGDSIDFAIPADSKSIFIAFPSSIFDITSVIFPSFFNYDIKKSFSSEKIQVKGGSNYDSVEYIVLKYIPDEKFLNSTLYKINV